MGHRDDGTPQCSSCQRYAPRQALQPSFSPFKHRIRLHCSHFGQHSEICEESLFPILCVRLAS